MKRLLFYVTALLLFLVVGLVYYFNEKKDFDGAAKYMEWGVMLMCAGVFLKMAPTKLYGNSGFLRAYVLSFALSGVCYWYTMSIVESYKDGADMPVTLIKQEQIKLKNIGSWSLKFTLILNFAQQPNERELPTDLAEYNLYATANSEKFEIFEIEMDDFHREFDYYTELRESMNAQIKFDKAKPMCDVDFLGDECLLVVYFYLRWNYTSINKMAENFGEIPISSAMLMISNPDSETDKLGIIYLPRNEERIKVAYDVTAHQRKKIDGSEHKWLDFDENNNVAGLDWAKTSSSCQVSFMIQTNQVGEIWAKTMEEKPLFSADQAFTSFLAFCTALFAFFSYFFPKTLPKRRDKFSNTELKFEAQSTFDVLEYELTQVPEADVEDVKQSGETTSESTKKILTSEESSCI